MGELTEYEKDQALDAFEAKQRRQYQTGKIIVFIISSVNIIGSITSAFPNLNIIVLAI